MSEIKYENETKRRLKLPGLSEKTFYRCLIVILTIGLVLAAVRWDLIALVLD